MKVKVSALFVLALAGILLLLPLVVQAQDTSAATTPMPTDSMAGMDMTTEQASEISPEIGQLVDQVRQSTANFRDFNSIGDAGYTKLLDCFVNRQVGGMGQHYVNGNLLGDDVADPMKPEALVYEPTQDGQMILVAFEYLIFASKWDPNNTGRPAPTVFGRPMHLMTNIPNTPPVWALHLWLWTDNPDGIFSDFNPIVSCPSGYPLTDMTPQ